MPLLLKIYMIGLALTIPLLMCIIYVLGCNLLEI